MIRKGFEPLTHSLEGCCSIQLSYRTKSLFQLASLLLTSLSLQRLNLITFVVRMLRMGATQASMLFYVTYLIVRCVKRIEQLADCTGLEPVNSTVTGWHDNQLHQQSIEPKDGIEPPTY